MYPVRNDQDLKKINKALNKIDFNLALIHSDILYGFKFTSRLSRQELLKAHFVTLKKLIDQRTIWMPSFNYDFPKTKYFDVINSKAEVGVLPEFFRKSIPKWRFSIPIFSFSGDDDEPAIILDKAFY